MLRIVQSNRFTKDLKLLQKRGYDLSELALVIDLLARKEKLPDKYKDQALIGNYNQFRECHVKSDWLLIYHIDDK